MKTETVECRICGQPFERRLLKTGNTKEICNSKKCKAISKFGNEKPVTLDNYRTKSATEYRADLDYHGRPYL